MNDPVAYMDKFGQVFNPTEQQCYIRWKMRDRLPADEVPMPLYTTPPQREWVDLTATEIKLLRRAANNDREFAELLQAKLKEKNT